MCTNACNNTDRIEVTSNDRRDGKNSFLIEMNKKNPFSSIILAAIPTEFSDCFGPYSPDAAAAAAMHYQFGGGYPPAPHGKTNFYPIDR